jgi:hypothetical protein
MSLSQRFRDVLGNAVRIGDLDMDKPYPVLREESVETKCGIIYSSYYSRREYLCVKVFLARQYSLCFSEEDISAVKEQRVHYRLIYKGLSTNSRSYILQIESDSWVLYVR